MFDDPGEPSSKHGALRLTLAVPHVSVRTANATDWQALFTFHESLYLETPSRFVSQHLANHYAYRQPSLALKDDLGCLLDGASGLVLVAEHDGELVGYITGRLQVDERRVYGCIGCVQDWFVVERCRGQGVLRVPPTADDLDSVVYTVRKSPADENGKVWPRGICQDIRKRVSENTDTDIHALRVEPFGAILGVDDVISHQTPNENQRKNWGGRSPKDASVELKMTHGVQALDADHLNAFYSDTTGRARERDDKPRRRRSVSRGRDHSPERYRNTFLRSEVRKFFRIWVTISHTSDWVWY